MVTLQQFLPKQTPQTIPDKKETHHYDFPI